MLIRVAIIEDEKDAVQRLMDMLNRYSKENEIECKISGFGNAITFLADYKADFDIIFMDINLPHMNGMEAATKLRKMDSSTPLIFVTNMAQYAIKGYAVDALDFMVKPFDYSAFSMKMKRAISRLNRDRDREIILSVKDGVVKVPLSNIIFVEISDHRIIYHTEEGDYNAYGTMKKVQQQLDDPSFVLCNSCYLVNLRFVKAVKNYLVTVGKAELQISHPKKKSFMEGLNNYMGGCI